MQIIPVIDYQSGRIVRAIGGRRAEYRPLTSRLTKATDPLGVARAIRDRYGLSEFYFADLDAIAGAEPALRVFDGLRSDGLHIWVDAGVRTTPDAVRLAGHVDAIVLGLETLQSPHVLNELAENRVVFSLDLCEGRSLGNTETWGTTDPLAIANRAVAAGINRMIVIDLAHVGGQRGTGTDSLCSELSSGVQVFAGGGVRGPEDLRRLEALGVAGALVASAIHDGVELA